MRKLLCVIFALVLCLLPTTALAAEYSIDGYTMAVEVQPDGSAEIAETLVYDFDGSYNGILSSIDIGDVGGLYDLALYVDGDTQMRVVEEMEKEPFTYTAEMDGDLLKIQAYAPGNGGERTFRYEYRLTALCQRYNDAARLNYKLIGTGSDVTLHNATIELTFPGEVYNAWAHGAMGSGDISYDGANKLIYGPVNVPSDVFVEADVLFDGDSLPLAEMIPEHVIGDVRELEAALEQEAYEAEMLSIRMRDMMRVALVALLLIYAALCALTIRKAGHTMGFTKKIEPTEDMSKLAGVRAAVAQWVYARKIDMHTVTGTLLELVIAGAVKMYKPESEEENIHFELVNAPAPELTAHQRYVVEWLFDDRGEFYVESLNAGKSEEKARRFTAGMAEYSKLVREEAEASGYLFGGNRLKNRWIPLLIVLGIALCVGLFYFSVWWAAVLAVIATAAMIVSTAKIRSLTDEGEALYAALDGFLHARMDSAKTKEAVRWAPIAAALGNLEPFFDQMDASAWDNDFPYWMYYGWHHDMYRAHHHMDQSHKHNRELLSQDSSSSSGGSSGGGGGGGGHGAW